MLLAGHLDHGVHVGMGAVATGSQRSVGSHRMSAMIRPAELAVAVLVRQARYAFVGNDLEHDRSDS